MPYTVGIETHQTCAGEVCGDGIIGENDLAQMSMSSIQRSVAFHGDDTVRDYKVNWRRRTDVEDATVDSFPVEDVLGPTVLGAGDHTEHIFHAQRDTGPVMCFDLWHRHYEVRGENSPRQPQMLQAGVGCPRWHLAQFIPVQVNEPDLVAAQLIGEST